MVYASEVLFSDLDTPGGNQRDVHKASNYPGSLY